jgi:hypothetical protein
MCTGVEPMVTPKATTCARDAASGAYWVWPTSMT